MGNIASAQVRAPWAETPIKSRESLKEALRCMIQVACYVAFYDPLEDPSVSGKASSKVCYGIIGASIWPESIGVSAKVGFPYGF